MSEKKPTARPRSAVKGDAVASGAMTQERLEADKKRTIAEVRAHHLAEIRKEKSKDPERARKDHARQPGQGLEDRVRPTGQFRTRNAA